MNNKYSKLIGGKKKKDNKEESVDQDLELLNKLENNYSDNYSDNDSEEYKLIDYQEVHAKKLIKILEQNNTALDTSDPGIGKTYIASYVCKMLNLTPIVICPKNVVNKWITVLNNFNVKYMMVVNYELISRCKYIHQNAKLVTPILKYTKKDKKVKYVWDVKKNVIFIFDEVHRCKFLTTLNAKLLVAAKETNNKILMLSATVVEKPIEFALFAYILGFSKSLKVLKEWIVKLSAPAKTLYTILYSEKNPKASRITIEELGDKFPETQITAETYTMKDSDLIKKEYENISEKIKKYKEEGDNSKFILAKLHTEFRNIELLKVPTFVELANDYIEDNCSVVIFVNYTDTLKLLAKTLKTDVLIHGGQNSKERDENIEKFQSDKSRIIIANIKAGGVGISLHDITGKHPRVALISPTQSATNLIQALGRVHRTGGKTKSLQRIIFAANTPEENISKMLFKKLANLSLLNDGDMESYYINGLIKDTNMILEYSNTAVDKDLRIIIDEQLERIKYKNSKKCSRMSELFPEVIDVVSGVDEIYLLQGNKIFENKEILILGEYHNLYEPCSKCDKNCIETVDLVTYVMNSLHPNMLDFYLESPYDIDNKNNKFGFNVTFPVQSRITKLYNSYKYLLGIKYPMIENLHVHAVDIRFSSNTNKHELIHIFTMLDAYVFDAMLYGLNNIYTNMIKPHNTKIQLYYNDNKKFFIEFENHLRYVNNMLSDPDIQILVKNILNGDTNLMQLFKITKQKNKFVESYNNNKYINDFYEKLEENIKNNFKNANRSYEYLMHVKYVLNSINDIKSTEDYIIEFLKYVENDKVFFNQTDNEHPLYDVCDILATYMDHYAIYRMLRKFEDDPQNNIIFYGGSAHTKNMYKLLINTGYFKVIVKKNNKYDSYQHDCQTLIS